MLKAQSCSMYFGSKNEWYPNYREAGTGLKSGKAEKLCSNLSGSTSQCNYGITVSIANGTPGWLLLPLQRTRSVGINLWYKALNSHLWTTVFAQLLQTCIEFAAARSAVWGRTGVIWCSPLSAACIPLQIFSVILSADAGYVYCPSSHQHDVIASNFPSCQGRIYTSYL